jgi:hypothetical protein
MISFRYCHLREFLPQAVIPASQTCLTIDYGFRKAGISGYLKPPPVNDFKKKVDLFYFLNY